MFGLLANNFTIPEVEIEDYVRYDVKLLHVAFYNDKLHYKETPVDFHRCNETDDTEFFSSKENQDTGVSFFRRNFQCLDNH